MEKEFLGAVAEEDCEGCRTISSEFCGILGNGKVYCHGTTHSERNV